MIPKNFFLLDAKEKPNIQKGVEFHALSFYPSQSEIWGGGRFTILSGGVLYLNYNSNSNSNRVCPVRIAKKPKLKFYLNYNSNSNSNRVCPVRIAKKPKLKFYLNYNSNSNSNRVCPVRIAKKPKLKFIWIIIRIRIRIGSVLLE